MRRVYHKYIDPGPFLPFLAPFFCRLLRNRLRARALEQGDVVSEGLFMGLLLALLSTAPHAQQAMEMFIPIGASPGVSNISSVIGTVATVSARDSALTVSDAAGSVTVAIPRETPIWLVRSGTTGTTQVGSPADLKAGLTVEVKYREAARAASVTADWIKVQID